DTLRADFEVGDRGLHGEVRHYTEARIRVRQSHLDDVARGLDGRRDAVANLRAPCVVIIGSPASAERRAADDRPVHGLQPLEHLAIAEAVPGASRRFDCGSRAPDIIRPVTKALAEPVPTDVSGSE